jgi:hemerythrin
MRQWSDKFCMRIEDIDSDHKSMFEMVDRLCAATEAAPQ